MTALLRPMTLGEILDRTFEVYRKRFFAFTGLSAIPALAMLLVHAADLIWLRTRPPELARLFGTFNIGVPLYSLAFFNISTVFQLLLYPSIARLCSTDLLGEPSSVSKSLPAGFRGWRINLGLALIQTGIVLVIPEVVCFALWAAAGALEASLNIDTTQFGGLFAPTFLFFVLAGIATYFWMWSRVGLASAALDRENLTAMQAVRRSFTLSGGKHRAVFVSQLVPTAIWWAFGFAVGVLARLFYFGLIAEGLSILVVYPLSVTFIFLGRWAIETLVWPIFPIATTLFYYDQRVRKEAYDLEKMMEAAGLAGAPEKPGTEAIAAGITEA